MCQQKFSRNKGAAAHMSKPSQGCKTRCGRCRGSWRCQQGYPEMCQQKPSQNKGLPRTCPSLWMLQQPSQIKGLPDALLLGGVEAPEGPRNIQGCASKNSHGTGTAAHMSKPSQGCKTRCGRCRGSWRCQQGYPEMCQQKPSQNKGLPRTCPSLWMLQQPSQIKGLPDALLLGGVEAPEGPRNIQGCASKNSHGTGAAAHMSKPSQGCKTRCGRCRGSWRCQQGYPEMCQQKPSQNKGLPRTCPSLWMLQQPSQIKGLPDALLLGGVEAPEGPRNIQGCASKNSHGTGAAAHMSKPSQGCKTRCGRCRGSWRCQQGYPEMCQQKPSQNKGLPRTCPSLWMLQQPSQIKGLPDALLLGGVEAPEGPRNIQGCASKNSHGTGGCRAHVEAFGCCNSRHRAKGWETRLRPLGNGEDYGSQKWSGSCKASGAPAPRVVLQEVPKDARAKTLGFRVSTFTPPREGPGRHGGGSRPALPGLHDALCRSRRFSISRSCLESDPFPSRIGKVPTRPSVPTTLGIFHFRFYKHHAEPQQPSNQNEKLFAEAN